MGVHAANQLLERAFLLLLVVLGVAGGEELVLVLVVLVIENVLLALEVGYRCLPLGFRLPGSLASLVVGELLFIIVLVLPLVVLVEGQALPNVDFLRVAHLVGRPLGRFLEVFARSVRVVELGPAGHELFSLEGRGHVVVLVGELERLVDVVLVG